LHSTSPWERGVNDKEYDPKLQDSTVLGNNIAAVGNNLAVVGNNLAEITPDVHTKC
jgi:hypothetical protein